MAGIKRIYQLYRRDSIFGFAAGGLGLFLRVDWCRSVTAISAVFSSLIFIIFWNGKLQAINNQGGLGLMINLTILIIILVFNWRV